MKKLIFLFLFISHISLADFDSSWTNIQNTDKSFLVKDAKESAKSDMSTENLGVKESDVNSFVNSTPQDQSTLESKGNSAYFSSDDPSIQALRSSHDSTNENNPETKKYLCAADQIVGDTERMLKAGILDYIKSETGLDINCVPIEGKSHLRDDPYVVGLDREVVGDPVYEPFFCEKRFNKYSCKDTLHLRCLQKSIAYRDWQDKTITISAQELFNLGRDIFRIIKPRDKVFEYYLRLHPTKGAFGFTYPPNAYYIQAMREFLASKHVGATIENISTEMRSWDIGGLMSINGWVYLGRRLGSKDYAYPNYGVSYKYRESYPICLNWHKEWREECVHQKY